MRKSSLPRAASRKPRRRLEEELTEHPSSAEGYALLGMVYSEQKNTAAALAAFEEVLELEIYKNAIERNPDNDQYYLSLALLELRQDQLEGARQTLQHGLARIPASGKLLWGQGLVSALEGHTAQAAERLEQAVDLLPEWSGSYSTLGVFYYQTGRIDKAKEVLNRFKGSGAGGGLDVSRIEEALQKAPAMPLIVNEPMPMASRQQLLEFALSVADRTL